MEYIIIDLEWNQATHKTMHLRRDLNLRGEVIQIGAVKINERYEIMGTFNKFIKPIVFSKMNPYVSNLLMLTDEDLAYCNNFPIVYREFLDWCGDDYVLLAWGNDDSYILNDNLKIHSFDAGMNEFLDLQKIYGRISGVAKGLQVSLDNALLSYGVNNQLMRHDALGDAMNTMIVARHAGLLAEVDKLTKKKKHTPAIDKLAKSLSVPDFVHSSVLTSLGRTELFTYGENALVCPVCQTPVMNDTCKPYTFKAIFTQFECAEHGEFYALFSIESFKDINYLSTKYYNNSETLRNYYEGAIQFPDKTKKYRIPKRVETK